MFSKRRVKGMNLTIQVDLGLHCLQVIFNLYADTRMTVVSYWQKYVHRVVVNCLED